MKKMILISVMTLSIPTYAAKDQSLLGSIDVPEGIKIVTPEEIGLTKDMLVKDKRERKLSSTKGYFEKNSQQAKELLALAKSKYKFNFKNEKDIYGTDLKRNINNIRLAFSYNGIKAIPRDDLIGFAVAGTYMNGWTGVAEYFYKKEIGICHYLLNNISVTKGGILLRDDIIRYDINKKPTNLNVEGNVKSGYLYEVNWYDTTFFHTLECASEEFDSDKIELVINLAKNIDKQISS